MISTANYSTLPDRHKLKQICKAISVLDAIMSQDWQYRYYSYNCKWSSDEEFCEMRNGEGDQMLILFRKDGCIINGMAHEFYPKDKNKLTKDLPKIYDEFIFGEPVLSIGTTFCIWTINDSIWKTADLDSFEDGSSELLQIFDGQPKTYQEWATDYYEEGFLNTSDSFTVISNIYNGQPLTKEMVLSLVSGIEDWEQLKNDLIEIDYPNKLD